MHNIFTSMLMLVLIIVGTQAQSCGGDETTETQTPAPVNSSSVVDDSGNCYIDTDANELLGEEGESGVSEEVAYRLARKQNIIVVSCGDVDLYLDQSTNDSHDDVLPPAVVEE